MSLKKAMATALLLSMGWSAQARGEEAASARELNDTGISYLERSEPQDAEKYFRRALAVAPGTRHYYNNLAASCMKQGKYSEAYRYLRICIAMDGNYAKALSNMAVVSFRLFKFNESYEYYMKALQADKEYTKKRFDRNRVTGELRKMASENPGNTEILEILRLVEETPVLK